MRLCNMWSDFIFACLVEGVDALGGLPETRVVLEDVVAVELVAGDIVLVCVFCGHRTRAHDVQREPGGIGIRVGRKSHLEHRLGQGRVEVKAVLQSFDYDVFGEVEAVAVEETVVCQSVHHGTWPSCCRQ
jgi:hypothetical protein